MAAFQVPPREIDVLIIGGGPAGAYTACALAREGVKVALLEASKFPRYHIGESLIPSIRPLMRFIGAEDDLVKHGFARKPGSAIKFNQFKQEGYTDFVALGCDNNAWNVDRSEFDLLLLNHARKCGVQVYEQTKVTSLQFDTGVCKRPISASWSHVPPPVPASPPVTPVLAEDTPVIIKPLPIIEGSTTFKYLIDATGRAGIMSTRYLKNRHFNSSLKNIALWGYWTGVAQYGAGTEREGAPWFEALQDESGWAWFIPLQGKTSVGIVMSQDLYSEGAAKGLTSSFSKQATPNATSSSTTQSYVTMLSLAPGVVDLISRTGALLEGSVKMASDFSYSAPSYAGNGYRIVGDAGAFIDPFFSSGIHLAMTSALSAAATVCASIKSNCSEDLAADWHTKRVSTSYTRFQLVVLSAYKQIRAQSLDILTDIDEDNYDRAFQFLRPVIQGAGDIGARLSEGELQKSLDFCMNLFNPVSAQQHDQIRTSSIAKELLDVMKPVVEPAVLAHMLKESGRDDTDSKLLLDKVNARRLVHAEYSTNNLELEALDGFAVRLERGKLGLKRV